MRMLMGAALVVGLGLFVWWLAPWDNASELEREQQAVAVPEPIMSEPTPPRIMYPLASQEPPVAEEDPPPEVQPEPLPELGASDGALERALAAVLGEKFDASSWRLRNIVRRFVVTVDNLLQPQVPQRFMPVAAPEGVTRVERDDEHIRLSAENYARYDGYVRILQAVDPELLVHFYERYYPLFQEAYEELGYPDAYFNDRLIEVIDSLLDAPEPNQPVELVQPSVVYRFADPVMEALPAGQKLMIRIGPDHAVAVKAVLREFRAALLERVVQE